VKSVYILADIPEVSRVLIVFIACGIKEAVVQNAAANPIAVLVSIEEVKIRQQTWKHSPAGFLLVSARLPLNFK
jgi:hypothetical protein